MTDELKQIIPQVLIMLQALDSKLANSIKPEGLNMLIEMAYNIARNDNIPDDKLVYAVALLVLNMLSEETVSNISSKKIKDVAITMSSGYGVSKWKTWYDALLNGDLDGKYALRYVGI